MKLLAHSWGGHTGTHLGLHDFSVVYCRPWTVQEWNAQFEDHPQRRQTLANNEIRGASNEEITEYLGL